MLCLTRPDSSETTGTAERWTKAFNDPMIERVDVSSQTIDLLACCRVKGVSWNYVARQALRPDGIAALLAGSTDDESVESRETIHFLRDAAPELDEHRRWVEAMLASAERDGIRLTTVLDGDYPVNLRTIFNLPPFLFYLGELRFDDARSVAVVGTRGATENGLRRASQLSEKLAALGVTVLSGLARGIDTAAHQACLQAGGRTIAVMGSGIRRIYPPENNTLAGQIAATGAVVSQFWPDTPPVSYNFPRRNIVTSGMGQGTVVIEASATSGAKMQARLALEHGKRVFLLKSLADTQKWAKDYVARGAVVVESVDDIVRWLRPPESVLDQVTQRWQLSLSLT